MAAAAGTPRQDGEATQGLGTLPFLVRSLGHRVTPPHLSLGADSPLPPSPFLPLSSSLPHPLIFATHTHKHTHSGNHFIST